MGNGIDNSILGHKPQNLLEDVRGSVSPGGKPRREEAGPVGRVCVVQVGFDPQKGLVKHFKQKSNGSRFAQWEQQWLEFMKHFPELQDRALGCCQAASFIPRSMLAG